MICSGDPIDPDSESFRRKVANLKPIDDTPSVSARPEAVSLCLRALRGHIKICAQSLFLMPLPSTMIVVR
jgi:hypothetical protein